MACADSVAMRAPPTIERLSGAINRMGSNEHAAALDAAVHAVRSACAVTRRVQSRPADAGETAKDDRSPVTVADFAAQAVVHHILAGRLSGSPLRIVGEESAGMLRVADQASLRARVVDAVRIIWPDASEAQALDAIDACNHDASADSYWTLDPVDGTKGFLRGEQYAVSLALIERGEVVLGVLGCANMSADFDRDFDDADPEGVLCYASRGGGAWQTSASNEREKPRRIEAQHVAAGRIRVCESVESGHTKHDDTARIVERLGGAGKPARLDSQCKYAVVARGQADAYIRMPTRPGYVEKIWDHAAGAIVATEAGAIVSDVEGNPLDFTQGQTLARNRGIVCASRAFHSRIIDAIRDLDLVPVA